MYSLHFKELKDLIEDLAQQQQFENRLETKI
jgi:hypothetical protein